MHATLRGCGLQLSNLLLHPRGKAVSLVTFFAAAKKVTRPRSGRKL
jgi:hypothetical protein